MKPNLQGFINRNPLSKKEERVPLLFERRKGYSLHLQALRSTDTRRNVPKVLSVIHNDRTIGAGADPIPRFAELAHHDIDRHR